MDMMNSEEFEKYIAQIFANLPRKRVNITGKEAVWLRIQNHIRETRVAMADRQKDAGFIANFLFLRNRASRVVATALVVLVAVSVGRGVVQAAIPGEALYPVKRATEKVEKVLATSDKAKVEVGIKHAKERLKEVQILVEENKSQQIVTATLTELKNTTQAVVAISVSQPELADPTLRLAHEQTEVLADVEEKVEGEAKQAVKEALSVSQDSIDKLTRPEEPDVKGSLTNGDTSTSTPSSTQDTTGLVRKAVQKRIKEIKDGVIGSPIQLHDVIRSDGETAIPVEPQPEIISEPKNQF